MIEEVSDRPGVTPGNKETQAMKRMLRWLVVGAAAFILVAPSMAAVDGEVELRYWNAQFKESIPSDSRTADAPGVGLRAEIVLIEKLAIAGDYFQLEGEDFIEDASFKQFTLDVKWRIIAPSENTFFGIGLGYQDFDASDDESISSNGFRIVADGRFGFVKILYVYGRLAYVPSLNEWKADGHSVFDGRSAYDFDFGLGITPIPLLTVWVGYRTQDLGFEELGGGRTASWEQSGPYLGAGIRF
jgi:hypothetical protein